MKNTKFKNQRLLIKNFSVKILLFLPIFLLFLPFSVEGGPCDEPLVPCGPGTSKTACDFCDFFVLLDNVVDFILFCIVPPLAILVLAIGGFMYILAFLSPGAAIMGKGGAELISQAKRVISTVIFGLIIIFVAWLIVNLFFQIIGVSEWTGLKDWWRVRGCP